ncbi:7941_t:CDS:1 [Funneliformis geosporum]|uniref:12273_t:CDS:1 n=1 Tax=Funneliformis geosporum TaxID=1117311 RepID=A0A9W4SNR0_9GLOM|nr:12273_t:CDS:1 [Funneliformis geosporum]CAI2176871.1 7941_t:CDS:1 [Funneliformis geosporum]
MSSLYLPNECIQDILNYVEEKDNKTFHSALLVNRTWCQNTVSFLWKKPFSSPPSDSQNNYKIIPILASFIDDDKKKQFKIKEKELPVPKKTTFDYPSFIKHLDFVNLWRLVFKCSTSSTSHYSDHITMNQLYSTKFPATLQDEFKSALQQKAEVVKALYEVILQRNRLERLSLSMKDWHFPNYNDYIFDSLTSTPNARYALARLTRFDCNLAATNFPVLFKLSLVSRNIKTLSIQIFRHIYRDGQLPELSKLIESQHSLEQINIFKDHKCNDISIDLSALVSQRHSLKKLKLHYVTIDDEQLKHITKLQQLQELMFTCVRLRGKMVLLTNACFPKLKVLRIYSTFIHNNHERNKSEQKEIDPFVGLMMNNGAHLRDLSLEFKLAFHPELLNNVAKYCENLITFTTYYNDDTDMSGIYEVLEKCSKIELFGIDGFANMPSDTIKNFSKKVPSNVKKLDFRYDCLDMDALKAFLESYEGHDVRYLICNVKGDKEVLKDMIEEISKVKGRSIKTCSVERGGSDEKVVNIEW